MGTITFRDIGEISSREETAEGFLRVVADFARTGIQDYRAGELPRDQLPNQFRGDPYQTVRILRPANEVFAPETMRSFANKPVTNDHPPQFVDARNFRKHAVGTAQDEVGRVNDKLRVGLVLQDAEVIDEVKNGKDQLSAGYSSEVIWEAGDDPVFGPYDAKQTNIRGNHIAVVSQARGGPEIRINDSWPEATEPKEEGIKMVERKINGITVEFSDQGAQAVDHLVTEADEVRGTIATVQAQLTDAQKEVERLQGELDAQKSAQLTDEQIETRVTERLTVIDAARKLHPKLDATGKSLVEIKTAAIQHIDSTFVLDGKSAEYIDGVFETFAARPPDQSKESMRKATQHADAHNDHPDIAGDARRAFEERNRNAWKGGEA